MSCYVSMTRRAAWDTVRCARLGYLVGSGMTASEIAEHPEIATSATNVRRQACRLDLSFREARAEPQVASRIALTRGVVGRLDAAALARGVTRDELIRRLLMELGQDASLIDNVLDDGVVDSGDNA